MFYEGSRAALQTGYAAEGDIVVAVMGVPIGVPGNTNLLRVMVLPEPRP
jgi:pyruvate kinase